MAEMEYPPTPPILPRGEDMRTPSPNMGSGSGSSDPKAQRCDSPEPNCAICLGHVENMCYTDTCLHKYCFSCLLQWSKVKAECPLCKSKFKKIIHKIESDDNYESYIVPPRVQEAQDLPIAIIADTRNGNYNMLQEMRRFRYATALMPSIFVRHLVPFLPTPRRRNALASTEHRRDIYRRHLYVDPESGSDVNGRYRECSPMWYRSNEAQTHRLVPWIKRELRALLTNTNQAHKMRVSELIIQKIKEHEIRSPEFHQALLPHLGIQTQHFQHEFYHFARSCYDMVGYDNHTTYNEQPRTISHEVISSDSDVDDIIFLEEVDMSPDQTENRSTENGNPSELNGDTFEGPSTSRGISTARSGVQGGANSSNGNTNDCEVEILDCIQRKRSPVVINISDAESENEDAKIKNEDAKIKKEDQTSPGCSSGDFVLLTSDSEPNEPAPTLPNSHRWFHSSEEEELSSQRLKGKGKGKGKKSQNRGDSKDQTPVSDPPESTAGDRPRLISPMSLMSNWRNSLLPRERSSSAKSGENERKRKRSSGERKSKKKSKSKRKRKSSDSKSSKERKSKHRSSHEERRKKRMKKVKEEYSDLSSSDESDQHELNLRSKSASENTKSSNRLNRAQLTSDEDISVSQDLSSSDERPNSRISHRQNARINMRSVFLSPFDSSDEDAPLRQVSDISNANAESSEPDKYWLRQPSVKTVVENGHKRMASPNHHLHLSSSEDDIPLSKVRRIIIKPDYTDQPSTSKGIQGDLRQKLIEQRKLKRPPSEMNCATGQTKSCQLKLSLSKTKRK